MDLELLKKYIQQNFKGVSVNNSYGKPSSVLTLATEYISTISDCSYKTYNDKKVEVFYKGEFVGGLNGQTSLSNKKKGTQIARDKIQTEKYLKKSSINTTNSKSFDLNEYEAAENYVKKNGLPIVVKPYNLSSGRGITLDVQKENFKQAWKKVEGEYKGETEQAKVLLQPQLPGIEARFLVIEGKFNSAILRVPTNVIGDGVQTIEQLLDEKNFHRARNAHLSKFLIKIDSNLIEKLFNLNLDLNSILGKDEIVFLNKVSNIALGGDTYEISHLVSDSLKRLAESAVRAIPDIKSAGVDIMFSSFDDENAAVLEVNHAGNLIMHHYPWKGEAKQPIFDLIDTLILDSQKSQKKDKNTERSIFRRLISKFK